MKRLQVLLMAGVAAACPTVSSSAPQPGDGRTFGFAMTYFYHDIYDKNPQACPQGFNESFLEVYAAHQNKGQRGKSSSADADLGQAFGPASKNIAGQPICLNPDAPVPAYMKPEHKVVQGRGPAFGLNLDGEVTHLGAKPAAGGCSQDDFVGVNGEKGVDNQLYRVLGCIFGRQNNALGAQMMHTSDLRSGLWNLLVQVSEVDSRENDPDVTVTYYSAADQGPFAAGVTPVPWRSVSAVNDPRFVASSKGRIVNGVLTSDPTDMHFLVSARKPADGRNLQNGFYDRELFVRGSRIRAKLDDDGLSGAIGGYVDVPGYVENYIRARGKEVFATGAAFSARYSCPSFKVALEKYADGYRDPATGKCTAISAAFNFKAIPVFVISPGVATAKVGD